MWRKGIKMIEEIQWRRTYKNPMLHRTISTCQKNHVKYVSTRIRNPLHSAVSSVSHVLLKELSFTIRTLWFGLDNKQWEWDIGRSDRPAHVFTAERVGLHISMPADTVSNVSNVCQYLQRVRWPANPDSVCLCRTLAHLRAIARDFIGQIHHPDGGENFPRKGSS